MLLSHARNDALHMLFIPVSHLKSFLGVLICIAPLAMTVGQPVFQVSGRPLVNDPSLGPLAASPTRVVIDLNGEWRYRADGEQPWATIRVPSSFAGDSRILFTRDFSVDAALAQKSVFQLIALSISYYCEIKLNGRFIGKHAGETSFSIKIPPGIIRSGRNTIELDVYPFLNAQETLPLSGQPWSRKHHGGILYDIALTANGIAWVQESSLSTSIGSEGKPTSITYRALLNSSPYMRGTKDSGASFALGKIEVEHSIEIQDALTGQILVKSDAQRVEMEPDRLIPVSLSMTVSSIRLWSPESPSLYTVIQRTTHNGVLVDESYFHLGFRNFSVKENRFTLNGVPYFLKGTSYLEYSPVHGRSLTYDELERDVLIMKNLGVNAVRVTNGVVHPYFLALCDRYGLLVFQDLPAIGVPSSILGRPALQATAKNVLREMISRDGTHPCIVAYGLAQGVDGAAAGFETYFSSVLDVSRNRDNKLLYASFSRPPEKEWPPELDFVSVDVSPTDLATTKKILRFYVEKYTTRPILISSLMYPVEVGNYNGYSDPRSIDAQAQFYLEVFTEVWNNKLAGIIVHSFCDWGVSIPLMSVDRIQQFTATAGILDLYRQKRLAYDVLKARFNNEKPPVLMVGNYSPDHPASFVVIGLLIILIFAVMYNLFRRFRENVVRSFLRPHNFFSDVRDQRMLSLFQTSVVGFIGSLSAGLLLANIMYFMRSVYFFDALVSLFIQPVWLKQWVNYASWNPLANIAVLTACFFVLLLAFALLLRIVSFFSKKNILLFDSYSVSMWSVLPMIILSPIGLILYRMMEVPFLEILAVLTVLLFNVWIVSRLFKGSAIVLDIRPIFFYFGGFGLVILGLSGWLISLDNQHETFAYLRYVSDIWLFLHSFSG
jgi:beta-galactosidase